jgi:hypothetical protein
VKYVGIDYHKKHSHITVVKEEGKVIRSQRLNNDAQDFEALFEQTEGPHHAVLEASRTWSAVWHFIADKDIAGEHGTDLPSHSDP